MKKTFSRCISILLCVLMLFSMSICANAVTNPTISVSSESADGGSTVTVTVSISNNPGIDSLQLDLDFDTTKLTFVKVARAADNPNMASGVINMSRSVNARGDNISALTVRLGYSASSDSNRLTWNGNVYTATFKTVNETSETVLTPNILNGGYIKDHSGNNVEFDYASGTVTITEAAKISAGSSTNYIGTQSVTVPVTADLNPGISKYKFQLGYDAEKLTFSALNGEDITVDSSTEGTVLVEWDGAQTATLTGDGAKLFDVVFTVKPEFTTGDTEITVAPDPGDETGYICDLAVEKIERVTYTAGVVTISQRSAALSLDTALSVSGDDVSLTASAKTNPEISAYKLYVKFDPAKLSAKSVTGAVDSGEISYNISNGIVMINWDGADATIKGDNAELFTVTFKVISTRTETVEVNISDTDSNNNKVGFIKCAGGVTADSLTFEAGSIDVIAKAPEVHFKLSELTCGDNQTVTVFLSTDYNEGFTSFAFELTYDPEVLTIDPALNILTSTFNSEGNPVPLPLNGYGKLYAAHVGYGRLAFQWIKNDSTTDFTLTGNLIALTFTVANDVDDGEYILGLDYYKGIPPKNASGLVCETELTDGVIEVENTTPFWEKVISFWNDLFSVLTGQMSFAAFWRKHFRK